jgi:hypothetical protein
MIISVNKINNSNIYKDLILKYNSKKIYILHDCNSWLNCILDEFIYGYNSGNLPNKKLR